MARLPPIEQISKEEGSGGYQSPCSLAAALTSELSNPGWTIADIAAGSTVISRSRSVESVMQPSMAADPPDRPVPAPRVTTGIPKLDAIRSVACTSAVELARTTASGRPGWAVMARS